MSGKALAKKLSFRGERLMGRRNHRFLPLSLLQPWSNLSTVFVPLRVCYSQELLKERYCFQIRRQLGPVSPIS